MSKPRVAIVGGGRAGHSFARAMANVGWSGVLVGGRNADHSGLADDADVVLLCVPDAAVASVAAGIAPGRAVIAHVAGSLGLDVLATHPWRASIHPLVSLPNAEVGAQRLVGATFAVDGDPIVVAIVESLGGTAITVEDPARAAYHAAACIASNHLVGLLSQVKRVAEGTGVPLEAFLDLVRQTVDSVEELGPAAALTGPAARGDEATLDRHRAVLDPNDLAVYDAMVLLCRRLAREV